MKGDFRFLLLLGAGVVAAAWAVTYYGAVGQLVSTGTNGYVSMVRGLEPPQVGGGGVAGGGGNFAAGSGLGAGGTTYSTVPFSTALQGDY